MAKVLQRQSLWRIEKFFFGGQICDGHVWIPSQVTLRQGTLRQGFLHAVSKQVIFSRKDHPDLLKHDAERYSGQE